MPLSEVAGPSAAPVPAAGPYNPLVIQSQLAALQGERLDNQNKLLSMAGQQAVGQALQGATDANGNTDYSAAMAAASRDPRAAYAMQAAADDAMAQKQKQYDLGMAHYGAIHQVMGAIADKPNPTYKDFVNAGGDLLNVDKSFTPGMIATQLTAISKANPTGDPDKFHDIATDMRNQAMTAVQQMDAHYRPQLVSNGQQLVPVNMAPMASPPAPIDLKPSPESLNQPVTTFDPTTGAPVSQPMSSYLAATKGGPVQAGPAQGTATAADANAQANAGRYQQTLVAGNEAHNMKALLGNMSGDLTQMQTGPGAEAWKQMAARANYWAPGTFDANSVATQENFVKASRILANHVMQAGGGTDMAKAFSMAQNPNIETSTEGNRRILAGFQGTADRDIVKAELANTYVNQHPNQPNA